ncbi:MAG: hypothetical protein OXP71_01235 [Candidatus Poribacteria bacterium]|nr:hypothetical protein [Candidatus Poribacteria bacterium]
MFSSKDLKVKLVYMGFGGMIAIIGMLIGIGMLSSVIAKNDKFGDIECSSLRVVDEDGITRIILSTDDLAGYDDENIRVRITGDASDGDVYVHGKGGSKYGSASATLGIGKNRIEHTDPLKIEWRQHGYVGAYGGNPEVGSVELSINEHGGMVDVRGKDPITRGVFIGINQNENGGVVSVYGMGDSKSEARLGISENGGGVDVFGKDGELYVGLSTDERGGHVNAYGKDGLGVALDIDEYGGSVTAYGKDGNLNASGIGIDEHGGVAYIFGKHGKSGVRLSSDEHGGEVNIVGKDGGSGVLLSASEHGGDVLLSSIDSVRVSLGISEHGGHVIAYGEGKSAASLRVDEEGGDVRVFGRGKGEATLSINEYGNGGVSTWDKNGYRQ